VVVVVVTLMNLEMHRQGLYYTDGIIRVCTDICCDAISTGHHHTKKLRLPSETLLPYYYNVKVLVWNYMLCDSKKYGYITLIYMQF
jgi:hypothetical protein